ncbi:putative nuclease HARBI1 [Diadema setosum]|uniref:putative nuclease HARBI1 n=1 Tax=Diadema setosum TaxID=31175 RepID=UPI003B3A787B
MAAIFEAINLAARRRERVFRDRTHPFDVFSDSQMYKLYRFTRNGCMNIIDRLAGQLQPETQRNKALSPSLQVFVALQYYATGAVIDDTSCIHGVHLSTASRTIRKVTLALCEMKDEVIKFPETMAEVRAAQIGFYELAGFPNVVGAIDCTHVELHGAPLGDDEYVFVNRKGKHSINVQIVCDWKYKITNVVARWPGSTHDSRILRNSVLERRFREGELEGILVGDSGYRLQTWLMTPLRDPQTNAERAYNRAHCRTRIVIEQVNGQVKNKFRCLLGQGIQMAADRACDVIVACRVLYNVSKDLNEPQVQIEEDAPEEADDEEQDGHEATGTALRRDIINNYFS